MTRGHELYGCDDNDTIQDDAVRQAKDIVDDAKCRWDALTCLYARGIMPGSWSEAAPSTPFVDARIWRTPGFAKRAKEAYILYTDGAGYDRKVYRDSGKVAAAGIVYGGGSGGENQVPKVNSVEGFYAEVPGKQTVPRAEAWAAALALHSAADDRTVTIGIDASYVEKGILQRRNLAHGENGDIWTLVFSRMDARAGRTEVLNITSHLEDEGPASIKDSGLHWRHIVGNSIADEAATIGEEHIRPCADMAESLRLNEGYVYRVVKRLAVIQARIWVRSPEARYEMPAAAAKEEVPLRQKILHLRAAIATNKHCLYRRNAGHACERCKLWRVERRFEFWGRVKCNPVAPLPNEPFGQSGSDEGIRPRT